MDLQWKLGKKFKLSLARELMSKQQKNLINFGDVSVSTSFSLISPVPQKGPEKDPGREKKRKLSVYAKWMKKRSSKVGLLLKQKPNAGRGGLCTEKGAKVFLRKGKEKEERGGVKL